MIVPSIDLMDGRAVQLVQGRRKVLDAGDPRPIAERFARVGEVAVVDLDAALGRGSNAAVMEELCRLAPCRVGGGIRDRDAALDWLDRGASKVVLGTAAVPEVLRALPPERVVAALDAWEGEVVVKGWTERTGRTVYDGMSELRGLVGGFLVTFVEGEGKEGGFPRDEVSRLADAAGDARLTVAGGITTAEEVGWLDRAGADAQVGMALYRGTLGLAEAFTAPLTSERADGLWPTVVTDERGGALGLAWSSLESVQVAIDEGRGTYHSRSRGLWRKGATSGATQRLVGIEADCDRDALRFTVRQSGAGFCHLDEWTCFGPARGLTALARTIADRRRNPVPGSLTARLLSDDAFLRGKLIEEAGELGEAVVELGEGVGDPGETAGDAAEAPGARRVVEEAADMMYFLNVALERAGADMADVERELDRRSLTLSRRVASAPKGVGLPGNRRAAPPTKPVDPAAGTRVRLRRVAAADVGRSRQSAVPPEVMGPVLEIVEAVRERGEEAVREFAQRWDGLEAGGALVRTPQEMEAALRSLPRAHREVLERAAGRIEHFARAQLEAAAPVDVAVEGGRAGDRLVPVRVAGCYAPGGRFPLPSSVLMTAVTARVAGVREVWLASPRPSREVMAAGAAAGAAGLLGVGGAHAVAAMAYGVPPVPRCDVVAGPGNQWVTAAKLLLSGVVGIDLLAGPSELAVLADEDGDPALIAADLLAQAEHDPAALPILVTTHEPLVARVEEELARQLADLPTAEVARAALHNGFAVVASEEDALLCTRELAAEHLQLHGSRASEWEESLDRFGTLFVGETVAEVFGDYGAGPNHTLPTGGTARFTGGLSVFSFLRRPTWLRLEGGPATDALARDTAALARMEGLEAHARAAEARLRSRPGAVRASRR